MLEGLRTWFRMINEHKRAYFGMPSVAVAVAAAAVAAAAVAASSAQNFLRI